MIRWILCVTFSLNAMTWARRYNSFCDWPLASPRFSLRFWVSHGTSRLKVTPDSGKEGWGHG